MTLVHQVPSTTHLVVLVRVALSVLTLMLTIMHSPSARPVVWVRQPEQLAAKAAVTVTQVAHQASFTTQIQNSVLLVEKVNIKTRWAKTLAWIVL